MRHLGSLIAGILIAPVAWLLIALGQQKSSSLVTGWVAANRFDTVDLIVPTAYLLVAGVLLGLVATLRVSPLGPLVAGLALLAPTVSLFIAPLSTLDRVPHSVSLGSLHLDPRVPVVNGTLPLIGVLLVIAVCSAERWRRWPVPATEAGDLGDTAEAVPEDVGASPYSPGYGGGTGEQPTTIASGWPETPYTVPPAPDPTYASPSSLPPSAFTSSPAETTFAAPVVAPWVSPAQQSDPPAEHSGVPAVPTQRVGSPVTSGVSDYESEPPPLPSRAGRPSPRPRHAASGTGEFQTLGPGAPVDRLAEAQRHAAAQTAAADAAYQVEAARQFGAAAPVDPPAAIPLGPGPSADPAVAGQVTESDQQAIADANRRTLAEAQAEASRRAAAELHAEAERRAQAESQRRAQARAQAEAQREADNARQATARQAPAPTTEAYWPAEQPEPADHADSPETEPTGPAPDAAAGLRPEFTQPTSPAVQPVDAGSVWPAEDPDQGAPQPAFTSFGVGSPDEDDESRTDADRQERAAQAERERAAAQAEAERRAALLAEAERRAQERGRNPRGDEPPTSPWSAPPHSR